MYVFPNNPPCVHRWACREVVVVERCKRVEKWWWWRGGKLNLHVSQ